MSIFITLDPAVLSGLFLVLTFTIHIKFGPKDPPRD